LRVRFCAAASKKVTEGAGLYFAGRGAEERGKRWSERQARWLAAKERRGGTRRDDRPKTATTREGAEQNAAVQGQ
jgi:hypothetical protein